MLDSSPLLRQTASIYGQRQNLVGLLAFITYTTPPHCNIDACHKTAYDYIRTHRNASPTALEHSNSKHDNDASPNADSTAGSDAESVGGETFKLTLRSAVTTITLTVRPTTTCGAIINAFLKSAGLADKYGGTPHKTKHGGPRLQIDGEKLNPTDQIGNADLEDGDCVDVVGL